MDSDILTDESYRNIVAIEIGIRACEQNVNVSNVKNSTTDGACDAYTAQYFEIRTLESIF